MFVLAHVTPPIFSHLQAITLSHPPIYLYPEIPRKPRKPQKNIVKNPPNPEMEPIQIANGLSKNIAPRNLPKSRKPPKKTIKEISPHRFQKAIHE
jgi:hypothetical protein